MTALEWALVALSGVAVLEILTWWLLRRTR
jgi:hypothetical protein